MKNRKKFAELMTILCEAFDRKPLSDGLIEIYWKIFKPLTEEEAQSIINQAILALKFFPKPAEILELLQGDKTERAIQAWEKFYHAISRIGPYKSVEFDNPAIHSTIELMGGWIEAGNWTTEEMKWKQKDFLMIYSVMEKKNKHPEYLAGIGEMENTKKGLKGFIDKPVFIGEKKELSKPQLELVEVVK